MPLTNFCVSGAELPASTWHEETQHNWILFQNITGKKVGGSVVALGPVAYFCEHCSERWGCSPAGQTITTTVLCHLAATARRGGAPAYNIVTSRVTPAIHAHVPQGASCYMTLPLEPASTNDHISVSSRSSRHHSGSKSPPIPRTILSWDPHRL
jgi:hypothetical protein